MCVCVCLDVAAAEFVASRKRKTPSHSRRWAGIFIYIKSSLYVV